MEFVPHEFCDSVVLLITPTRVAKIEKLTGYWSKAARNPANHHLEIELVVLPVNDDLWDCSLSDWSMFRPIDNWKELIAANYCLVLNAVTVAPAGTCPYSTLSTAELMNLLLYCYRRPFEGEFGNWGYKVPKHEWSQIAKLFENVIICRIELDYEPGCREFLVRALASQHLVAIHIRNEVPTSLHSHILEWARRVEFEELWFGNSPNLQFEFSVFEKFIQRIEGGHARSLPLRRNHFDVCFSKAVCEKIRNALGTAGFTKERIYSQEYWTKEQVLILINCFNGNVQYIA